MTNYTLGCNSNEDLIMNLVLKLDSEKQTKVMLYMDHVMTDLKGQYHIALASLLPRNLRRRNVPAGHLEYSHIPSTRIETSSILIMEDGSRLFIDPEDLDDAKKFYGVSSVAISEFLPFLLGKQTYLMNEIIQVSKSL